MPSKLFINLLSSLLQFLKDDSGLNNLSIEKSIVEDRPLVVLERMAALDMLSYLMESKNDDLNSGAAKHALESLIDDEIEEGLSPVAQNIILAEKFDALVILMSDDPQMARHLVWKVEKPGLRKVLEHAALSALVNSGMPHEEALAFLAVPK